MKTQLKKYAGTSKNIIRVQLKYYITFYLRLKTRSSLVCRKFTFLSIRKQQTQISLNLLAGKGDTK